jgi:hypothetical protein
MTAALAEVPGPMSPPVVGHTLPFLRDALGPVRAMQARYGDAFRLRVLGREVVVLVSPDATRDLDLDRDRGPCRRSRAGPFRSARSSVPSRARGAY